MDFFGFSVIQVALILITLSLVIILACLIILFFKAKKRAHIDLVLKKLDALRENNTKKVDLKLEIKKDEFSLKKLLIDKFKPVIEKQLKTKVEILDFNAKNDTFLALVEVNSKKLLLVLDSSGKIIDYKKVK